MTINSILRTIDNGFINSKMKRVNHDLVKLGHHKSKKKWFKVLGLSFSCASEATDGGLFDRDQWWGVTQTTLAGLATESLRIIQIIWGPNHVTNEGLSCEEST